MYWWRAPASHYQPDKLIEKFDALKTHFTAGEFYEKMLYYRLLLDYYTIRRDIKDGQGNYSLILKGPKDDNDKLKQYQSMLYVSTEAFYNWLKPYLRKLEQDDSSPVQRCSHSLKKKIMNVTAYYLPEKIFHIKHPVTLGTGFGV